MMNKLKRGLLINALMPDPANTANVYGMSPAMPFAALTPVPQKFSAYEGFQGGGSAASNWESAAWRCWNNGTTSNFGPETLNAALSSFISPTSRTFR